LRLRGKSVAATLCVLAGATCPGLASPSGAAAIDLTGVTDADIEGHSGAYGLGADRTGPGGSGALSLVARELGLAEHNQAVNGSTMVRGSPQGDDWVQILTHTPRTNPVPPYEREPRIALIWHGGNDFVVLGDDFGQPYAQLLRTVVSRHRSSAVYEETDSSVGYTYPLWSYVDGPGQSGSGLLFTRTEGAPITIRVQDGRVPAAGTLDLGFYAVPGHGAFHAISVDGASQGVLDTRGVATSGNALGLVYRMKNLPPGPHTITITPHDIHEATYFDYWQVEPRVPEPVVLVNQYRLPGGETDPYFSDAHILALNAIQDSVASEFDDQVVTVDTDAVIKRSPGLIADGLHPNQQGHNLMAAAILARLGYPGRLPPTPDGGTPASPHQGSTSSGPVGAKIKKGPEKRTARRTARFRFRSSNPGVSYLCRFDDRGFSPCGSPMEYARLRSGNHRFVLRATDGATGAHQRLVHHWRVVGH
jgi:lysophospholipase L1-like esterase